MRTRGALFRFTPLPGYPSYVSTRTGKFPSSVCMVVSHFSPLIDMCYEMVQIRASRMHGTLRMQPNKQNSEKFNPSTHCGGTEPTSTKESMVSSALVRYKCA